MKHIYKILMSILLLSTTIVGIADTIPVEEWNRTYNVGNVESSQQTLDGGYIIIDGSSILKMDTKGNLQWNKNYTGLLHSGQQTTDRGYILGGTGDNNQGPTPAQIIKLDTNK